jgi:hypothetical protein
MRPSRIALAAASLCLLGFAAWALIGRHRSGRDYAAFGRCPVEDPATDLCLYTSTRGGVLKVGAKAVPVRRTITLQGGVQVKENEEREVVRERFIGARGGETLSRTPEDLPGGLPGAVDAALLPAGERRTLERFIARGLTAVTATVELAAPASAIGVNLQNLVEAAGTAISLPVKVRLASAFLGTHCYIGSAAHPITLALGTGRTSPPPPNRPIKGRVGHAQLKDNYGLTVIRGSSLVDNSFAAPAATGCGGARARAVDPAVDSALGLPARAGENTVILDGTLQEANARAVRASE